MRHVQHMATRFIAIEPRRCTACWDCIEECPRGVIGRAGFLRHKHAHIDQADSCVGCRKCVRACPHQAILEIPRSGKPADFSRREWERAVIDLLS